MRWYFLYHGISSFPITEKLLFWNFWRWKIWYFWATKLMKIWYLQITEKLLFWSFWKLEIRSFFGPKMLIERWYLLITEKALFWTFRWLKIRSFFESRSWWEDDIYWLLRSSYFELFVDGNYGLFSAKKLMKTWYLHGFFELSMTFQELENMVFCAVVDKFSN